MVKLSTMQGKDYAMGVIQRGSSFLTKASLWPKPTWHEECGEGVSLSLSCRHNPEPLHSDS